MAQTRTATTETLAEVIEIELSLRARAFDEGQRTVVVDRDDDTASVDGVQAVAERRGYFVFATDDEEITLVAYDDCAWKSRE